MDPPEPLCQDNMTSVSGNRAVRGYGVGGGPPIGLRRAWSIEDSHRCLEGRGLGTSILSAWTPPSSERLLDVSSSIARLQGNAIDSSERPRWALVSAAPKNLAERNWRIAQRAARDPPAGEPTPSAPALQGLSGQA